MAGLRCPVCNVSLMENDTMAAVWSSVDGAPVLLSLLLSPLLSLTGLLTGVATFCSSLLHRLLALCTMAATWRLLMLIVLGGGCHTADRSGCRSCYRRTAYASQIQKHCGAVAMQRLPWRISCQIPLSWCDHTHNHTL